MTFERDTTLGLPALALTAGLATRLRPLSAVRAKAALPIAGQPLVRRILRWLGGQGVSEVVLNLHHLPESISSRVGDGGDLGVRVRYSWETPVLGSAGGPRRALPLLGASTFLIVNGDTLTDADIPSLLAHHRASNALVTLAVVPNTQPTRYGGVLVDERGWVTGFVARGSQVPSYHFFGVQVAEATAFETLSPDMPSESIGALYPELIRQRPGSVVALRTTASWLDIGTPGDYLTTCLAVAAQERQPLLPGKRARVDTSATIERTVIWDDVAIDAGARLSGCIVCDGVHVPAGTSWQDVTIRVAAADLFPGERRVGNLAVGPLPACARAEAGS